MLMCRIVWSKIEFLQNKIKFDCIISFGVQIDKWCSVLTRSEFFYYQWKHFVQKKLWHKKVKAQKIVGLNWKCWHRFSKADYPIVTKAKRAQMFLLEITKIVKIDIPNCMVIRNFTFTFRLEQRVFNSISIPRIIFLFLLFTEDIVFLQHLSLQICK